MKHILKLLLLTSVVFVFSCSDLTDLDINQNPNAVAPENAEVGFLYNQIQLSFNNLIINANNATLGLTRQRAMTSYFYREAISPNTLNAFWSNVYANLFPDVDALEVAAGEGFQIEVNSSKVLKAYALMVAVDMLGNIPYSDAGKGVESISPVADDQASLYSTAEALLDEAIAGLSAATTAAPAVDIYYGGNADNWIALANTLKLRIYSNTRLVDGSAGGKMASLISSGANIIDTPAEDFQFQYGTERNNPNSRHPYYNGDYEQDDGGYMSTYYMWLMTNEKGITDPRTRFYFYRQQSFFSAGTIDINEWDCVLTNNAFETIPPGQFDHYTAVDPDLPYCLANENGYFGRDHGNGQGIPPDGPIRVEYGIYPAGGKFDNNSFDFTQTAGTLGALGAGINPIWLSSYTDFIRAEAALAAGTGEDARALLQSAVEKSLAKVLSFSSLISSSDLEFVVSTTPSLVTGADLIPGQEAVDAYVAEVLNIYDNATDKLDVIAKEYMIALWTSGLENYNLYRRTGKPNNMPPLIDPQAASTASFPRTMLYPADYVNLNQNATQRETTEQVFWDNNPAGFIR